MPTMASVLPFPRKTKETHINPLCYYADESMKHMVAGTFPCHSSKYVAKLTFC